MTAVLPQIPAATEPATRVSGVSDDTGRRDASVQSVNRAISILQVLAHRGPTTMTDIAAELDIHKSTASRLLSTLEARGLLEQTAKRGRYQLGPGIVQLAAGVNRRTDLTVISRRTGENLAEAVGETVNIAVRDGNTVLSIDQIMGPSAVTTINWVGQRNPIHVASAGKLFLAYMSAEERDLVLTNQLERYTQNTITSRQRLEAELPEIRQRGYATTFEEHEIGLAAVAAPIRDIDHTVVAAITVSGPTFRINADTIPAIAQHVVTAAAEISQRNGEPKPG